MIVLLSASPFAYVPEVEQPRSFGHFVGDVLTQRIPLDQGDRHFRPTTLPTVDRVGLWFARLPSHIETDAAGGRWLIVDYQVINSPVMPVSVSLPALTIPADSSPPLKVDGWPIQISPLSAKPAYANIEPTPLRPDRLPVPLPTRVLERRLVAWSLALAVVLSSWLGWLLWADRRDASRLPFARALRQLRGRPSAADDSGAWICLHRALDEAAGRAIHEHTVDRLFASAPQFEPLRAEVEDFYRRSSDRFFREAPVNTSFPLVGLCRKLRRIEKRTSRGRVVRS